MIASGVQGFVYSTGSTRMGWIARVANEATPKRHGKSDRSVEVDWREGGGKGGACRCAVWEVGFERGQQVQYMTKQVNDWADIR